MYERQMDDCGSMCCELTGEQWDEWAAIDECPCDCCEYARNTDDDEEEWSEEAQ
jgi:hypothetical protein